MDAADLERLATYMEWADRRTLASVRDVPEEAWERAVPASYGSLAGTVEHIFAAEWTWLERVEGRSPATVGPAGGVRDRARLDGLWPAVWSGWRRAAARLAAEHAVDYRTSGGAVYRTAFGEILLHLSHHSATYRGQVVALLRSMGREPANTDLIAYLRGQA